MKNKKKREMMQEGPLLEFVTCGDFKTTNQAGWSNFASTWAQRHCSTSITLTPSRQESVTGHLVRRWFSWWLLRLVTVPIISSSLCRGIILAHWHLPPLEHPARYCWWWSVSGSEDPLLSPEQPSYFWVECGWLCRHVHHSSSCWTCGLSC